MKKNIKMIINKINYNETEEIFKNDSFKNFYKEFQYNKNIEIIDLFYIHNKLLNIINRYKYIFLIIIILILILFLYLKR